MINRRPGGSLAGGGSWVSLGAIALVLNALWEISQLPLYRDAHGIPACLLAAVGDGAIILGCTTLARFGAPGRFFWPLLIGLLAAVAVGVELWALTEARWAYAPSMPTIAGIGLAPLVQLPILGSLAVLIVRSRGGWSDLRGRVGG